MTASTPPAPLVPFGRAMRKAHFGFSPSYVPLNHGSYGATPLPVRAAHAALQNEAEAAPDRFIVLDWPARLHTSRGAAARVLRCDTEDLVFVPNATTGIDTILKNLVWAPGDVVLVYEVVYEAVRSGLLWLEETRGVRVEVVQLRLPLPDAEVVEAMVAAARRVNRTPGERLRLAIVDTIVSMPGLRVPFEKLVPALQGEGALVLVDGAHGIGHIDIDLSILKPDFFVTNLHKWLFVPRGAAALYVPGHHQALIRTSLPTSARYRKLGEDGGGNAFIELFDFTATLDMTNFLTVSDALSFRNEICGGEAAIQAYCNSVAQEGGEIAASIFGTSILDAPGSCARECSFVNIRLPLEIADDSPGEDGLTEEGARKDGKIDPAHAKQLTMWFKRIGVKETGCYLQTCAYVGGFWWRLSGMVYLDLEDVRMGAEVLKGLCERAKKGEYLVS